MNDLGPPSGRGQPPARFGHYRVTGALGTGISTALYRAEADGIGRPVVLKVLRSTAGRESVFFRRFEHEARLLSSLRHPNVIELFDYDAGATGERPPYMVLEHVEGGTLREVLERTPRLPPEEAAAVALEIARGLAYAHGRGVVHRDVKPANVLLGRVAVGTRGGVSSGSDDRVVVKVLDFGVAQKDGHDVEGADGDPGDAIGTPAYMSPEQLLGESIDARSDQFALGIVLYQMLAGGRPFDGDDGRPAIQRIRRDPPRPLERAGVTVPRTLERIVLRLLAKRPADRFERTEDAVAELSRFLEARVDSTADLSALHRRVLARAGILDERRDGRSAIHEEAPESRASTRAAPLRVRSIPLRPALVGMGLSLLAMASGGTMIQARLGGIRDREAPRATPSVGEAGNETARIRVLVRPWAEVIVDGRRVDVTPLAGPIPVRPGKHVVLLQHPSATERRVVDVAPGQMVSIDVALPVPAPNTADEFLPPPVQPVPASASASAKPSAAPVPSSLVQP